MTAERVKTLLFEVAAAMDRAVTSKEFEALEGKYRALKNLWNELTGNAVLAEVVS